MKPTRIGIFIISLFVALAVNAQNKIYFIEDVTETGEPVGHSNTWAINAGEESDIYMLYTHNKKVIPDTQLTVKIQILGDGGKYNDYSEDIYNIEKGSTYVIFQVPFADAGNFRVMVIDSKKKNLAIENLELVYSETSGEEISPEHAKGYKITFCDSITGEGVPLKEIKEFKLKKGEAKVTIYISHPDGLLFSDFSIKITQAAPKKAEIAEIPLSTEPTYGAVYYDYTFTAAGTYTIAVLSASGQILNFDTVTIK